ncbi:RNA-dependent RNA polymerase [Nudaurelia capensis beta virus]|uniref:Methyltransferase/helicase/RNA-directed RNA polymerase n=1 Tax=Nudaurelia capensis beta virus (isolate Pine emperor moth/South Africa) TaxID=652108 RepID=RDRP_NCBVS|nr:RNA-dependent RNA polymerase [Nudaurelia capensis beta virus]Q9YRB3.1 RecName: Full=Methyltransferase/helicase/RNA-directed RNA polymerase [Nudaurelia capensis beta virus isolate South Africa]AAC97509.1 RNA-dependent RNA polymerase [Nudaurelia capensis beta virus]
MEDASKQLRVLDAQERAKAAFQLDFIASVETLEDAQEKYEGMMFRSGTKLPSTHIKLAIDLRVAEKDLRRHVKNVPTVLEIGPSVESVRYAVQTRDKERVHGCTFSDARDNLRHNKIGYEAHYDRKIGPDAALLAAGIPTDTFCVDGFSNCEYQSPLAIACHSLYPDGESNSIMDVAKGMALHGTHVIYAWMHLPVELLTLTDADNIFEGYSIRFEETGALPCTKRRKAIFSGYNDFGSAYVHDAHHWAGWLKHRGVDTPYGFSILIDIQQRFGMHTKLKITRGHSSGSITTVFPLSKLGLIWVPNIVKIMYPKAKHEPEYIVTDKKKYEGVCVYVGTRVQSSGKSITLAEIVQYIRTRLTRIILNGTVHEKTWTIAEQDIERLAVSIMFRKNVERAVSEKALMRAQKKCKSAEKQALLPVWMRRIANWFQDKFQIDEEVVRKRYLECLKAQPWIHADKVVNCETKRYNPTVAEVGPKNHLLATTGLRELQREIPSANEPQDRGAKAWHSAHADLDIYAEGLRLDSAKEAAAGKQSLAITLQQAFQVLGKTKCEGCNNIEIEYWTGPPGSGKSRAAKPRFADLQGGVLYCAPTRTLRDALDESVVHPSRVCTYHNALHVAAKESGNRPFDVIVIDEAETTPACYVGTMHHASPSSRIVCLGDPHQIGYIDFSDRKDDLKPFSIIAAECRTRRFNTTYRCPQDVLNLPIFKTLYPDAISFSKQLTSIRYLTRARSVTRTRHAQTLTQDQKPHSEPPVTAHEPQARRTDVIVHYAGTLPERALLEKVRHINVALTRHTNALYIRDESEKGELVPSLMTPPSWSTYRCTPVDKQMVPDPVAVERENGSSGPCDSHHIGAITILQELGKLTDTKGVRVFESEAVPTAHRRVVLDGNLDSGPDRYPMYQFTNLRGTKYTNIKDNQQALHTLVGRYARKINSSSREDAEFDVKRITARLKEWIPFRTAEPEQVDSCFADAMQKIAERGHGVDDIEDFWSNEGQRISYHLKGQQKVMDPTKLKLGQGISAHEKCANIALSAWVRIIQDQMSTSEKFIFANGQSDRDTMSIIEARLQEKAREFKSIDIKEFDTVHNWVSILVFSWRCDRGCPEHLIEYFEKRSKSRTLSSRIGSVDVSFMLDSGAVWTIARNTLFASGLMLALFVGVDFIAAKGDDVFLAGNNLYLDAERLRMGSYLAANNLKIEKTAVVSFIGFIVSQAAVTADVVRLATRTYGRSYKNADDLAKYKIAIADHCKLFRSPRTRLMTAINCATLYGTSKECINYLMDALDAFGHTKMSDLHLDPGFVMRVTPMKVDERVYSGQDGCQRADKTREKQPEPGQPGPQQQQQASTQEAGSKTSPRSRTDYQPRPDGRTREPREHPGQPRSDTREGVKASDDGESHGSDIRGMDSRLSRPGRRIQDEPGRRENSRRRDTSVNMRSISRDRGRQIPGTEFYDATAGWRDLASTSDASPVLQASVVVHHHHQQHGSRSDERRSGCVRERLEQQDGLDRSDVPKLGASRERVLHGRPDRSADGRTTPDSTGCIRVTRELPSDIERRHSVLQRTHSRESGSGGDRAVPTGQRTPEGEPGHSSRDHPNGRNVTARRFRAELHIDDDDRGPGRVRGRSNPATHGVDGADAGVGAAGVPDCEPDIRRRKHNHHHDHAATRVGDGNVAIHSQQRDGHRDRGRGSATVRVRSEFGRLGTESAGHQLNQDSTNEHEPNDAGNAQDHSVPTQRNEGLLYAPEGVPTRVRNDNGDVLWTGAMEDTEDNCGRLPPGNWWTPGYHRQQLRDRRCRDDRYVYINRTLLQGVPTLRSDTGGGEPLGPLRQCDTSEGRRGANSGSNLDRSAPIRIPGTIQRIRGPIRDGGQDHSPDTSLCAISSRSGECGDGLHRERDRECSLEFHLGEAATKSETCWRNRSRSPQSCGPHREP